MSRSQLYKMYYVFTVLWKIIRIYVNIHYEESQVTVLTLLFVVYFAIYKYIIIGYSFEEHFCLS